MIITQLGYYNHYSDILIGNDEDTITRVKVRSPKLFEQSNLLNPKLSNAMETASSLFYNAYIHTEKFIMSGESTYRNTPIRVLSFEEEMFITNNLGVDKDSIDYIINHGISYSTIRVFVTDLFDIDYRFFSCKYENSDKEIISLFIGKKFKNDTDILRLIYDLTEAYIDLQLELEGVPFNRIKEKNYLDKAIVMDVLNPSDALFVAAYHINIFKCVIRCTNRDIISCASIAKICRPYMTPFTFDLLLKFWKYAEKTIDSESTDSELLEVAKEVYSYFIK